MWLTHSNHVVLSSLTISNEKCKLPNHFVSVLPVAEPKINDSCSIKGQSVGQSLLSIACRLDLKTNPSVHGLNP